MGTPNSALEANCATTFGEDLARMPWMVARAPSSTNERAIGAGATFDAEPP